MSVQTIPDLFLAAVRDTPRADCFSYRGESRTYVDVSSEEALRRVRALRFGLKSLGVKPGDKVAILSENRLEWALSDLGILCSGAVSVPIYSTLLSETIEFILKDCQPPVIFVSTPEQAAKIHALRDRLPFLRDVISFEQNELPDMLMFDKLLQIGQNLVDDATTTAEEDCTVSDKDAPCSIIYTSGTTGNPKGVVLSHWNFVSNVSAIQDLFPILTTDKALSFLPLSHVLERMAGYYTILNAGAGIAFAERMDTVPVDILEVKPTLIISVPRLYEKIYTKATGLAVEAGFPKKNIFFWAREVGIKCAELAAAGESPGPLLSFQKKLADVLVFTKLRAKLGGNIRFMVSGGAPLSAKINTFFFGAGLFIYEGYGLTETSPVLSCNYENNFRFGSIGKPLTDTEIRIAEDGEIQGRGPQVMLGYFNNEEATREVLDDQGWFSTGDIGHFDEDGFLFITDRKKDLIVTAGGKNIAPQPMENRFRADKFVSQIVVIGDRRQFLSALIVPDFDTLGNWAEKSGIQGTPGELILKPKVRNLFEELVERINRDFPGFSQVRKFELLEKEFTLEAGELTPTLKVKRFAITRKFKKTIDAMYPEALPGEQD
ncbi:MAG: long-chain fatty acid--CoA ligase [Gemmatimonadales bacterium]|nr:long-chain fatty acid--CoA ligase [Gemmatimonadales bacterium]